MLLIFDQIFIIINIPIIKGVIILSGYIFSSNRIPVMLVPSSIADRFLGIATGAQIKVILCLIRFEDMALTVEDIAKQCNISNEDVKEAINFWIQSGIIIRRGASLLLSGTPSEQPQTLPRYNPDTILERKTRDNVFSELLDEIQRILGKTLNHNDASVVVAMYDHLGFSPELTLQLINYCLSTGKSNFRYIEKVALDWFDRGIDSFEKAETLIRTLEKKARLETAVQGYFGIDNRALSKKEKEYIEVWTSTLGMSIEMIKQAYEVCIDKKSKISFPYINGILADWAKKGFKNVADITNDKLPSSNDKRSFSFLGVIVPMKPFEN